MEADIHWRTTDGGGARLPEDGANSGVMEDRGEPERKEEPLQPLGWRSGAEGTVRGEGGVTTDQGGGGGTREPGEVKRPRVSGGAEGRRAKTGGSQSASLQSQNPPKYPWPLMMWAHTPGQTQG